ncbi:MAG: U32 family peptidase [Alphaproteobacteria bacterium]|nr:U32 family peptidase [Alphaproteobacteria bacterium]
MAVKARLSLGPVLFNWPPEQWRDFYLRVADEADVDAVHVGEVVCSKRQPFVAPHFAAVIDRLRRAGKEVVYSSLALVTNERDAGQMHELCAEGGLTVEINDIGLLRVVGGRPHVIGPLINIYNEGTLAYLADQGAVRACLPPELPLSSIDRLAAVKKIAVEVFTFGRMPLALSARCFHARAHHLHKDGCQFVCGNDPDGLVVETLDRKPFLAVNGMQVMSHTCCNLLGEFATLRKAGVGWFRLSPMSTDMVAVARLYRLVLNKRIDAADGTKQLAELLPGVVFSNGFLKGREGRAFLAADELGA